MMIRISVVLFILIQFIFTHSVSAQEQQIDLSVDKTSVERGEPIQLTLFIRNEGSEVMPQNITIQGTDTFGQVGESISNEMRVINGNVISIIVITRSIIISEEGEYQIGPAEIEIEDENGQVQTLQSNTVSVNVQGIPPEVRSTNTPLPGNQRQVITQPPRFITLPPIAEKNEEIKKEAPFLEIEIQKMVYYALISILVVLLARLVWQIVQNYRSRHSFSSDKQHDTPVTNQTELMGILPEKDNPTFYRTVKQNLIQYLEQTYHLHLSKHTTQEIRTILAEHNVSDYENVTYILEVSDKNRYAKTDEGKEEIVERMKKIIYK